MHSAMIEQVIFNFWLSATTDMEKASGETHTYLLGKCTAFTETLALVRGITFIEANRLLMNWREQGA